MAIRRNLEFFRPSVLKYYEARHTRNSFTLKFCTKVPTLLQNGTIVFVSFLNAAPGGVIMHLQNSRLDPGESRSVNAHLNNRSNRPYMFLVNREKNPKFLFYTDIKILRMISARQIITQTIAANCVLRVVPMNLRSQAMGINIITVKLIGSIPAPIIAGALIDRYSHFKKILNNYRVSRLIAIICIFVNGYYRGGALTRTGQKYEWPVHFFYFVDCPIFPPKICRLSSFEQKFFSLYQQIMFVKTSI